MGYPSLPKPFMVIATQNPTGAAGTQLLPDSQIDRFMIKRPSVTLRAERSGDSEQKTVGCSINDVKQICSRRT
jgi:hypothetical protein